MSNHGNHPRRAEPGRVGRETHELDGYLDGLRQEGRADSSGQFALDIRQAVEKLAQFFPPSGQDFLQYWVRFAVFYQPPEIWFKTNDGEVSLEFAACGPSEEEVRTLFAQGGMGLRYLQMAVVGALRQGYSQVKLRTPHWVAAFQPEQQSLSPLAGGRETCQLRATRGPQSGMLALLRKWRPPKAAFPTQEFLFLETPVRGILRRRREAPQAGLHLPEAAPEHALGLRRFLAPGQRVPTPARVVVVVHGAQLPPFDCSLFPAGSCVVIEAPDSRLDLSLRQLIEPALAPDMLRAAQERLEDWLSAWVRARPRGLWMLPCEVADWWLDRLLLRGDRAQAWESLKDGQADLRAKSACPLSAALLERASLLSAAFEPASAPGWHSRAQQAWDHLEEQSRQLSHFARLVQIWESLAQGGCVLPRPSWLTHSLRDLPLPLAWRCYRQIIRDSAGGVVTLEDEASDNVAHYYLLARLLLRHPVKDPALAITACEQLVARATDASPTVEEKLQLALLVSQVCQHALKTASRGRFELRLLQAASLRLSGDPTEAAAVLRVLLGAGSRRWSVQRVQRLCQELRQLGLHSEAEAVYGFRRL